MPSASRGKQKRHSLVTPSETSESSEESRTTSPEQMDVSSTEPQEIESPDSTSPVVNGSTVAMSIGKPRLTVNGKRVGRPPGTFKTRDRTEGQMNLLPSPIICRWSNCNTEFFTVAEIVEHVFAIHTKEKATSCKWDGCDNRPFKSFYMLVGHIRTHTGERPMKCTVDGCSKAYKTRENLNTHIRTHTGEKPYQCQFRSCGKRFTNASDRGKHENRCHSKKKEYICDVENCVKSYTDPSSLRKHVICVHGPEAQEKRKKIKVRWVYRRDGLKVDNSNDSGSEESFPQNGDVQMEPMVEQQRVDPMMSLFQAIEAEDALLAQLRRQSAAAAVQLQIQQQQIQQQLISQLFTPQPTPPTNPESAFRPVIPRAPMLLANTSSPIDLNAIANAQAQAMVLQYLNAQAARQTASQQAPVLSMQVQQLLSQLLTTPQEAAPNNLSFNFNMTPGAFPPKF